MPPPPHIKPENVLKVGFAGLHRFLNHGVDECDSEHKSSLP